MESDKTVCSVSAIANGFLVYAHEHPPMFCSDVGAVLEYIAGLMRPHPHCKAVVQVVYEDFDYAKDE